MRQLKYTSNSKEVKYLLDKDQRLNDLFSLKDEIIVNLNDDYFGSLVGTIISQQLSTKVAQILLKRLSDLFDHHITADQILTTSDEDFRNLGLSRQKIQYLKSLAECHLHQVIDLSDLEHLTNQDIIDMLIKIKGIGIWSAQMFLMFSLGREDVFSVLDLGLRNAVKKVFNKPDLSQIEIEKISEKWIPYRSVVAHYLWHAWDN